MMDINDIQYMKMDINDIQSMLIDIVLILVYCFHPCEFSQHMHYASYDQRTALFWVEKRLINAVV